MWRQPLGEAYDRLIDSPIADMKNVGPREAGSITAAQFIKRYVDEGVAWAHLDIAGMAWSDKAGADLRQGRDRLRRAPARPIYRRRGRGLAASSGCGSISISSARRSAESVIAAIAASCSARGSGCWSSLATRRCWRGSTGMLWDQGAASFLPHGLAGGSDDAAQPILLSTGTDAPNLARNLLIADGEWREAALGYDRAFYLFDGDTLEGARLAWKLLAGRDGVERNYWAHEDGRWVKKA